MKAVRQIAQGWLAWVSLGAAAGAFLFAPGLGGPGDLPSADPSGAAIERAVAEAEAQGEAARTAQAR